jgi:predicted extracellular nuclease
VGDQVLGLAGGLDYELGIYLLALSTAPQVSPGLVNRYPEDPWPEMALEEEPRFEFRVATFNLSNLFDTQDDPAKDDTVLSSSEYQRRLQKRALAIHESLAEPEFVAVQEVENENVLRALTGRPELNAEFGYVWEDGPDLRGIDVALLYRKDRVQIMDFRTYQGCTKLVDGLGPDGNGDVENPQNGKTCDTNGDGKLDGNRLFSRTPLLIQAWVCSGNCLADQEPVPGQEVWLVVNHFKSKVEDTRISEYTLPRRLEEAEFVADLAKQIQASHWPANVLVLGDLNDYPASQPLAALADAGLQNGVMGIAAQQRYSFIFQGVSQVLDYGLFSTVLPLACVEANSVHINADYPVVYAGVNETVLRSSDHDPVVFRFQILEFVTRLPVVKR